MGYSGQFVVTHDWGTTIILAGVLPHEGMLPVGLLSFWVFFSSSMVEGCGHVGEGGGGGATQAAQRRVVHGRRRCAAGASSTCP